MSGLASPPYCRSFLDRDGNDRRAAEHPEQGGVLSSRTTPPTDRLRLNQSGAKQEPLHGHLNRHASGKKGCVYEYRGEAKKAERKKKKKKKEEKPFL